MNTIQVPAPEIYQRWLDSGLTRYDRETVVAALADLNDAEKSYELALSNAPRIPQWPEPAFWDTDTPEVSALRPLVSDPPTAASWSKGNEYFPVKQWAIAARQHRTLARKINAITSKPQVSA